MDLQTVQQLPHKSTEDLEAIMREAGIGVRQLQDIIRYAFARFDENGDGEMSLHEFQTACGLLSLQLPTETTERLFKAFSKGKGHFTVDDVEAGFEQDFQDRLAANLKSWYDDSPFKKGESLLDQFAEVMGQHPRPLTERLQRIYKIVESQGEALAEFVEFIIASTLLVSKLECFPNCAEVDPTDVVPLVVLLGKNVKDMFSFLADRNTTDLSEENAAIFATVFKPTGMTVASFETLFRKTCATWVVLPAGTKLPIVAFQRLIGLVGRGRLRIQQQVAGKFALSETVAEVGLGSFLGMPWNSEGVECGGLWSNPKGYIEVVEDARLLRWEHDKLREYFSAYEEDEQKFRQVFARSTFQTAAKITKQSGKIAKELPAFFRDVLLHMMNLYESDRASLWVHDDKRAKLWTLFVKDDGSSTYFEIDDTSGLAGYSFANQKIVNIPDCYVDERFNANVDKKTGYLTRSMLCIPVADTKGGRGAPIGVIQLINRMTAAEQDPAKTPGAGAIPFSHVDEEKVKASAWQTTRVIKHLARRYNAW